MPKTPDRDPGVSDEEGTVYSDEGTLSTQVGEVRYKGAPDNRFSLYDGSGEYDPRAGGGGLSPGTHRPLDQLVHEIAETSYEEVTYSGNQVTDIIIWTTSGKTQKIRETNLTYTGNKVNTVTTKQYDGAGVLIAGETLTETFTYTGGNVTSIDKVLS